MLLDTVKTEIVAAVKSRDPVKAGTYRYFLSAIRNFAIAKYGNTAQTAVTDDDVIEVARKQVKSRRESIEAYSKAGRKDLVAAETRELEFLTAFLPRSLSDAEIEVVAREVVANHAGAAFGPLMGLLMSKLKGQAEGKAVSAVLKKVIAS
jgi:hypothetical protein